MAEINPTHFFESKATYRLGHNVLALHPGIMVLNSQRLSFIHPEMGTVFELPLEKIERIIVKHRHPKITIQTTTKKHVIYTGTAEPWMYGLCFVGLAAGIVPGILIYFLLILPNARAKKSLLGNWQRAFAWHAIRTS